MRNRDRLKFFTVTIAVLFFLPGCVTPIWDDTPGEYHAEEIGVRADIPSGWSRMISEDNITLTKDGLFLQLVRVNRPEYGAKYENTNLTISPGMTPLDASQIVLDDMHADQDLRNLTIIDNQPANIAGYPGFRIEFTYTNEEGLTIHEIVYVSLTPNSYLVARCRAPDRFYMETISGDFERIVASIKLDVLVEESG